MPTGCQYRGSPPKFLRRSASSFDVLTATLPSASMPSATSNPGSRSKVFVHDDIHNSNNVCWTRDQFLRSTKASSSLNGVSTRITDILDLNDRDIHAQHCPLGRLSHTTSASCTFSVLSHPASLGTVSNSCDNIELSCGAAVHASSPASVMAAFPATVTAPRCHRNAKGIYDKADQPPREQALSREYFTTSSSLTRGLSSSSAAPRMMSRRSFNQLLEETRRRSRCNSQPTKSVPSHWSMDHIGTQVSSTPVRVASRTSSLSPLVESNSSATREKDEDPRDDVSETIQQLEQLADQVRAVTAMSVSRSPTRRGFCEAFATSSEESLPSTLHPPLLSRTPTPVCLNNHLRVHVPQIVVTLPSSEHIPSFGGDSSSPRDSVAGSEELSEEIRWINDYGRWGSPTSSHEDSGSDDSSESDVSSLFVAGEGEGLSDSETICTSPPTSPRGDDTKVCSSHSSASTIILTCMVSIAFF